MSNPTAPALPSMLRTPTTAVWLVLIAATALSWMLGTDHGFGSTDHSLSSVVILLVAFVKVRFIGLWFMELRDAPLPLRALFEAYCIIVCTLTISLFVFA
jgi:hypothetical protein